MKKFVLIVLFILGCGGSSGLVKTIEAPKMTEDMRLEKVNNLLSKGENANSKNQYGYTALMLAAERGQAEVMKALLAKGADVNAVIEGKGETAMTKILLTFQSDGVNNRMKTAKVLIDHNINLNIRDQFQRTALHWAAKQCMSAELVSLLIKGGAFVNVQDEKGETPLTYAEKAVCNDVVKVLKDNKAE